MSYVIALLMALAPQSPELERAEAIKGLIDLLEKDPDPQHKAIAQSALVGLTGEKGLTDAAAWKSWWETTGKSRFPDTPLGSSAFLRELEDRMQKAEMRADQAKREVRAMATVGVVAILLFMIVMLFFVGHVSSKIKGWRELVGRAEIYVKHGQELTDRTDKISAELDAKRAELGAHLEKLRKEQEEEIARRGDQLGTELAHQLRMELQTMRQKAERELDQTVTDLKTQLETTARRAAADVRDRLAK
jgi:CHASE3 domain sensor protein